MMRPRPCAWALGLGALLWAGLPQAADAALGPYRAPLQVTAAGPYEAVLPPALHSALADGSLDLLLLGPDGQARSLELYWAQGGEESEHALQAESYSLKDGAFLWEAALPPQGDLAWLRVEAAQAGFSGRLSAELLEPGRRSIATDRALFDGQPMELRLDPPLRGRRLRLTLSGMDPRFRSVARLLGTVQVGLRRPGQAPARQTLRLVPVVRSIDLAGRPVEEAVVELPGSGLQIEGVDLRTRQALIGSWELGRERLSEGRPVFAQHSRGVLQGLSASARDLRLPLGGRWDSRELRLRLDNHGRATGPEDLRVQLRLPRFAFEADAAGLYWLVAGAGQSLRVQERPVAGLKDARTLTLGPVQMDPAWRPESLAERFALQGGPLDRDGFTWRAQVQVPAPGYWRLSLPQAVLLEDRLEGLRLEQDGHQVPYFLLQAQARSVSLSVQAELDAKANRSRWTLSLPQASRAWTRVSLRAAGVFQRRLSVEWRRPGAPVWISAASLDWVNRGPESRLDLPLGAWTQESAELRLSMDHGDNRPVELSGAEAVHRAEDLAFVVAQAGALTLWGGKAEVQPARYDLDLLRQELMGQLPGDLAVSATEAAPRLPWHGGWARIKAGSQLWFYLALAVVTVGLLALIAKLLPRA